MFRSTFQFSRSVQILAAAAYTDSSTIMYSYRGGRNHNQWQRRFSNRSSGDGDDPLVTGDSHFESVRDSIRGFQFEAQPRYVPFYNPRQPPPFNSHYRPPFNHNQRFGPPQPQHFRPRPQKPLDYRNWEYAKPPPPPNSERFTVLSYNILADYLATNHRSKLYFHIPRHILDWDFRKRSIIFELGLWSADILCFQEVDRFQDLEEELKVRGYRGIWKMRTGDPVDGCAIFWRFSRFQLLHEESIEFNKHGLRDNVAQICVLELMNQNHNRCASALSSSSPGSNKVVICNIHVLYNPKRGEIKLGQVRLLLSKAYAVSKLWDDAPVVLCGDFNCTPKSPMYNFISEQKLNLSELHRDKLSGQASAEIRASRPFIPNFRPQPANYSAQAPTVVDGNSALSSKGAHQGKEDARKDETESTLSVPVTGLDESPSSSLNCVDQMKNGIHECPPINSISEDICPNLIETAHRGDIYATSNASVGSFSERSNPTSHTESKMLNCEKGMGCNYSTDATIQSETVSTSNPDVPLSDFGVDFNVENSSPDELIGTTEDEILHEDCTTFLSKLHNNSGHFPSDVDSPSMELWPVDVEKTTYDQSAWTPMEIESATGNSDCTLMEHPLKLRSTYSEVEDYSGTRDSNGEPLVTSYNRCFLGTVDYIWCSEGLQTVRVLAPIPRHAMQWTPGFPTKKWGSDHIALVSELAFTKDETFQNAGVR